MDEPGFDNYIEDDILDDELDDTVVPKQYATVPR